MNSNVNGDGDVVYANNTGSSFKNDFLPHGLCHFYLRHGYCKNRANCRWDHPPLGDHDRPDYRNIPNDREDNGHQSSMDRNGYNATNDQDDKKDRVYHNRDDFQSYADHPSHQHSSERSRDRDKDKASKDRNRSRDRDRHRHSKSNSKHKDRERSHNSSSFKSEHHNRRHHSTKHSRDKDADRNDRESSKHTHKRDRDRDR
eukprot:180350_1